MESETDGAVTRRLVDFIDRMDDVVGVCDETGRVLYLNDAARKQLGFSDVSGLTTVDFFGPDAFKWYYEEVRPELLRTGTWRGDLPIRTQTGDYVSMSFSVVAGVAPGGEITGLVTHGRPRTDPRPSTNSRDANSPEWAVLGPATVREWIDEALARAQRQSDHAALIWVRVKNLRQVIATRGAFEADGVTRAVGRRLTRAVRTTDVVARIAQDAFIVLFENMRDLAELLQHARALQDAFDREPVWTASGEVPIDLTLGVALADANDTPDTLMQRAEAGVVTTEAFRQPDLVVTTADDLPGAALCEALRIGVMTGAVRTHVLTAMDTNGVVVGYEAFARWAHPGIEPLGSQSLRDLAEQVGVGSAIELRVLREAAALVATSPGDVPLRIYAPVWTLLGDVYVEQYVWEIADAASISPEQIHLLVDHALVAAPHPTIRDTLRSLRDHGCRLAIADVDERADLAGIIDGHRANEVRLTDGLIRHAHTDAMVRRGTRALIQRAHDLGATVLAAGIDTAVDEATARELGVEILIGAFFGQSVAADSIA
jgi:diguanylate cyclase (GGDEF)-like protein